MTAVVVWWLWWLGTLGFSCAVAHSFNMFRLLRWPAAQPFQGHASWSLVRICRPAGSEAGMARKHPKA